jgi:hypothetical protein
MPLPYCVVRLLRNFIFPSWIETIMLLQDLDQKVLLLPPAECEHLRKIIINVVER